MRKKKGGPTAARDETWESPLPGFCQWYIETRRDEQQQQRWARRRGNLVTVMTCDKGVALARQPIVTRQWCRCRSCPVLSYPRSIDGEGGNARLPAHTPRLRMCQVSYQGVNLRRQKGGTDWTRAGSDRLCRIGVLKVRIKPKDRIGSIASPPSIPGAFPYFVSWLLRSSSRSIKLNLTSPTCAYLFLVGAA